MTECEHEFVTNKHGQCVCTKCGTAVTWEYADAWIAKISRAADAAIAEKDGEIERLTTLLSGMNEAYVELSKKLNERSHVNAAKGESNG